MLEIPTVAVALLGFGATLKYAYKVFSKGQMKNYGAFISMLYLTLVYTYLTLSGSAMHGGPLVRVGIILIFLDKMIIFSYELWREIGICKKKRPAPMGDVSHG